MTWQGSRKTASLKGQDRIYSPRKSHPFVRQRNPAFRTRQAASRAEDQIFPRWGRELRELLSAASFDHCRLHHEPGWLQDHSSPYWQPRQQSWRRRLVTLTTSVMLLHPAVPVSLYSMHCTMVYTDCPQNTVPAESEPTASVGVILSPPILSIHAFPHLSVRAPTTTSQIWMALHRKQNTSAMPRRRVGSWTEPL